MRIRDNACNRFNRACNGFNIVVYGCQIVQRIHGAHKHLGAEIYFNAVVLLVSVGIGLAFADVEMDEALVVGTGLIHAAVRNGEELIEVEGELVVISGNSLLFRLDFQALGSDACVLANLCQVFIFVIDKCKGCAEPHGGAAYAESAGSDRDPGLFHSLDHHIAAVYHGAVQDPGTALSVSLHHGHSARKAHALALAAYCPCQGLGCQKACEPVVQILSENGIRRNAFGTPEITGELNVGLIVVDAYSHTHGENICVDRGVGGRCYACAGSIGAVVCAIFGPGINALCAEIAVDQSLGLVGSDIDTHGRSNVHGVLIELLNILSGSTGVGQSVVCGFVVCCGSGGQIQAQRAQHHGHQGAVADAVCKVTVERRGDFVELPHNLVVDDAGRGGIGEVCDTENRSDFFEVAVKACTVSQSKGLRLVLVQSFRINNDTARYVSLPVKLCIHIGSGEIDGNGSSHRGNVAGGKAGGGGVGLTALTRVQVKIRLLVDLFALIVCTEHPCGADDISAAERQACALIDRSSDGVLYDIQRRRRINRDVLGAGLVCGQKLSDGRSLIVGERLLSANGVLTCYGDRINVVVNNGLYAECSGIDRSVHANACLCLCVHIGHGERRTHAYPLTGQLAHLVFDGQTVVCRRGGSGGVDLIGGLGIQLQNTGQLHLVLGAGRFQAGEDGLRVRVEDRHGKAAGHAHVRSACAGDSGGTDAIPNIFQLAGIAVLGGKLGNGGLHKQIHADCDQHLLFVQLLTNSRDGGLIVQQGVYKEAGVKEQVCQILEQAVCQSHCRGGDCAQRIALQIGEHDLEDHVLYDAVLFVLKLLQFRLGKRLIAAELFDVLIEDLLLLFLGEVVPQGVFILLLIEKRINKNVSAAFGARKIVEKLRNDLVHAAAVCRFQDVRADDEIVSLDGLRANICLVLILHIVDCRCRAHTDGAAAGGGVREDDGVGVLKGCDAHIACCLNAHTVCDAGKSLVGMNIRRDGGCHLHAALGGLHTGALICKAGHTLGGHAAVFAGHAVYTACRIDQRCGVFIVDVLRAAVLVHGLAGRGVFRVALAAEQANKLLDGDIRRSGGADHRGGACACRAGVDVLAYTADGLCRHLHALRFYAAVEFSHGGVVKDGKTHCRAYACPAAHCLCVGDELADSLGVCDDKHITGHPGHGVVEIAHKRLGVHRADSQRHDRCHGDTAGGTGCSLNIEVCLIVCLCLQRAEHSLAEADAVFDLCDGIYVDHFHRDARAHACGVCGHLESGDHGYADAANLDALSGALAGGVGNGGVSAAAGGNDFHIAAADVIACRIAEHGAVIYIGHVHGDRAADAQLGLVLVGGMACLGNGLGACVQGLRLDAQILRPDSALVYARFIAVHEHFDGNRRADGVPGRSLHARIGAARAYDGGRAVQGAVCTQIRNAAAGGMDKERRGGADAFCHIHFCKVRVLYVRDAQSAHQLICAAVLSPCGCGGVLEDIADAVGAGERPKSLAIKSVDAEELGNERNSVRGGQLVAGRLIVEGNCQRDGAGSHIGERIHHHIVHSRDGGIVVDDCLGRVEDKVACHEHAGLGVHIPHDGGLAGGVAGAVHDAGGENLQGSARVDLGVIGDLCDGLKLHHGKGDGEREDAAQGVGHQVIYRVRADEDAPLAPLTAVQVTVAGDQFRRLADSHLGVPGGNCQCDGDAYDEKLIFRVDRNIHIGAGMDVAARVKIAVDGHIGVAELQGNGVKVLAGETAENIFTGNESLVEDELCVQVNDLVGEDLLVFCNNNVDIAVGFEEPKLNVDIVIGVKIVFYYAGFKSSQCLVLAVGGEDDVLCADGPEHIDLLADDQKVQSPGVQTVDAQLAADGPAQIISEDYVREENAVFGHPDVQAPQVKVDILIGDFLDFALAVVLLDLDLSRPELRRDHVVCEGLERIAALEIFHRYRALVEQCVGESFYVPEENLEAFGKIKMECVVGQIAQNGDLCQSFNGDFRSVSVDGDALVFINAVIEFAGQMQAVVAGLILDLNSGAAPCSEGSGGIHCDKVVALTAVENDAVDGKRLAVKLVGDEVYRCLHEVLCEAEVTAAADAEPVLAIAAVHPDIGCAHVHGETELIQGNAVPVSFAKQGHDNVAGVNELDAARVLAFAKLHIHAHSGGIALRAVNTVYEDILQGINIRKNIIEFGIGADEGRHLAEDFDVRLTYLHRRRHIGLSSHFHIDRVIARAAVHPDVDRIRVGAALDVGDAEVYGVVLLCTVVFHTARIFDADSIAGGEVQTRKQGVEPIDVDVYAALQLYIALGLCIDINDPSLLILHNGVMGHDANGQLTAIGGAVLKVQQLFDQRAKQTVAALLSQIHTAKVQAVLHHDGGNALCAGLLVLVQVTQIGQSVCHGLVDGVAIVVGRVVVLDLFAYLMYIGAACGNGVGLHFHLILGDRGYRLSRVIFPGRTGSQHAGRSGCCPVTLNAIAGRRCGGRTPRCGGRALRCGGRTLRCGGRTLRCGGRTLRCGGRTLRCGGRALRCAGRTLRCGGRTLRCGGRTLRCVGRTLRCGGRADLFGSRAGQVGAFALCVGNRLHGNSECQHGTESKKKHYGADKHPHCTHLYCRFLSCVHVRPPFPGFFAGSLKQILFFMAYSRCSCCIPLSAG